MLYYTVKSKILNVMDWKITCQNIQIWNVRWNRCLFRWPSSFPKSPGRFQVPSILPGFYSGIRPEQSEWFLISANWSSDRIMLYSFPHARKWRLFRIALFLTCMRISKPEHCLILFPAVLFCYLRSLPANFMKKNGSWNLHGAEAFTGSCFCSNIC